MTLLCHTQKASFSPPSAAFQPSGPRRAGSRNSGGLLAASSGQPGLWDVRRWQGKPRQTFPKLGGLGRDPGRRRACAPPAAPSSQGFGEPGWSRTSLPRGPPSPCSQGSRGSGAVRLPSRLEVAARRRALRSSAIFAHGSLQEGFREAASREGGERPDGGQEIGHKPSLGEARGNYAPWLGGKPSGGRLQRAPWPGAQAVASWFCIRAEAPALAATVAGMRVSSPPLLLGPWGPKPASRGGGGGGLGPGLISAASRQPPPRGFGTCSKRPDALTSLWKGAGVLLDGGGLCGGPQAPGESLGSLLVRGKLSAPPVARSVFHLGLCPGNPRRPGHACTLPTLGTSPVALGNLGGRTRQRSGLETHHRLIKSSFLLTPPPPNLAAR